MKWEYRGAQIHLDDDTKLFTITYPGESASGSYQSWGDAVASIDNRRKAEQRANRTKISVPVLHWEEDTAKARKHTITGIHGGHGGYTAKPPLDRHTRTLYLDHPYIEGLLKSLVEALNLVSEIRSQLNPFELDTGWGRSDKDLDTAYGVQIWWRKAKALADSKLKEAGIDPSRFQNRK